MSKRKKEVVITTVGDRIWHLFVASPSDVAEERNSVRVLAERLNRQFSHAALGARLDVSLAEYDVPPGGHPQGPQALIEKSIRFTDFDFFLAIFWKRIGTPVGRYPSGTARELAKAYKASQAQRRRPRIMVYRKVALYYHQDEEGAKQVYSLAKLVAKFKPKVWMKDFETSEEFRTLLHDHLYQLIAEATVTAKAQQQLGVVPSYD